MPEVEETDVNTAATSMYVGSLFPVELLKLLLA